MISFNALIGQARSYAVNSVNELWHCDCFFLPRSENYIGGLLAIDVFSRRIYVAKITNKKTNTIKNAFEKIFAEARATPIHLGMDYAGEFVALSGETSGGLMM